VQPFPLAYTASFSSWLGHPLFQLGETPFTVLSLLKMILWIIGMLVVVGLLQRLVLQRLLAHTRMDRSVQFAINRITGYVLIALGLYVSLVVNGFNLSSLAVIAGALGIGLGFGLQNIVSNFVSGLIILAERPIVLGDRIEVGEVAGQVRQISLRSTTVVTNDNISIIIPNSDLVTQAITNWSHGDPRVRIRVPVGVAYGTDPEKMRQVLQAVAEGHPDVLKDPAPSVFFDSFGDSSLNFELAVWTHNRAHAPRRFRSPPREQH
jgi:small-conductance mechanosensitive channel